MHNLLAIYEATSDVFLLHNVVKNSLWNIITSHCNFFINAYTHLEKKEVTKYVY